MGGYGDFVPVSIGWPSLIPPILAMGLALSTKEVVSSLFSGAFSAAVIYAIAVMKGMAEGVENGNVFDILFSVMGIKISENVHICLFILFIGGLINLVSVSGGAEAYAAWAKKAIKGRRKSMFSTAGLGCMMFLDDYFNSITTSTVMYPVTSVNHVSRAKTAYIVHTISTNMCITIPLTSWAAAIVSQIKDSGIENSFLVFLRAIPFNIYSLLSFTFIIISIAFDFDYGRMKFFEDNAKLGIKNQGDEDTPARENEEKTSDPEKAKEGEENIESEDSKKPTPKVTMWDLLLPIIVMVILAVYFMFYLGYVASGSNDITVILGATSAPKALLFSCFVALIVTLVMYVPRKIMTFTQWIDNLIEGMKSMISTLIILVLAWCVSGLSGDLLETGKYIGQLVKDSAVPPQMIPAVVFLVGMVLSFATGTAWGTFSLLIPIAVSICKEGNEEYLVPSIASCLCGAVFGNNTSPISDTTVLVSSAVHCSMMSHVSTQLPYSATVAGVSIIGFLIAGFSKGNLALTLGVSFVLEFIVLGCLYFFQKSHHVRPIPKVPDEKGTDNGCELTDIVVDKKPGDNELSEMDEAAEPVHFNN